MILATLEFFQVLHQSICLESFFLLKKADKPFIGLESIVFFKLNYMVIQPSVMIFSLTWFLRTHFYTHVINLIYMLFRSLCPHNLSFYTSLDC